MRTLTTKSERAAMVPVQVIMVLNVLGHEHARIAGGAVRDSLLGNEPKDWDVATDTRPEFVVELAEWHKWPVRFNENSLAHGTVTVHLDGMDIEITTLRVDAVTDGRHAEVEFTNDWKLDAERRDLTFNAMFMDADGTVYDYFDGQKDLLEGRVRFVGCASTRIQEDYLRILRFFRFAGRMGCEHFDCEAMRAMKRNVNGLHKISGERIWMEMSKILTGPLAEPVFARMEHVGIFNALGFPQVEFDSGVLANWMKARPETVLAALLDTPEAVAKAADEWKLSAKERKMAEFVASHTHDRRNVRSWSLAEWEKVFVVEGKERTLELLCLTSRIGWKEEVFAEWEAPVFPLSGADLIAAGVEPGPEMGRKLKAAKQAWLDAGFALDKRKLLQLACAA